MLEPILSTKLFIPKPRAGIVTRPRLIKQLTEGLQAGCKLTLISASAGFGKTTLISEWLADSQIPVAWLSLDERDTDPVRFMAYLGAALQTIMPGIGNRLQAVLKSSQPYQIETILTTLINDISAAQENFLMVLDDYHSIDSAQVDQLLVFLIDHQPPQLHLVIASREDPNLPLARLRARGQLMELRAADLRFTPNEAADYFNRVMSLNLSAADITALEMRTEGWITGLQLAALSLKNRENISDFIQAFSGGHHFVLDYLVEEVLLQESQHTRTFLLQTAILDRLCAPLCNAVTGREDGKEMLSLLEHSNLFLIPLDDQRQWYRYHHLFAEVLRTHLMGEQPERISSLHQRASAWFEQNHIPSDAIRHALAASDFERAADLIEAVWLTMDLNYQYAVWLGWVQSLPEDLIRARPVVSVGYAWALLGIGELEAIETRLRDAERWLEPAEKEAGDSPATGSPRFRQGMVVVDQAEFLSLPASIAAARAYRAMALGDISGAERYARQSLALTPDEPSPHRTQATALLALAEYSSGDLPAAERDFLAFQTMMWQINDLPSAIGITFVLANIKLVQGRLREALSDYQQSLHLAVNRGASFFIGVCELHRGLSELYCEQDDLDAAAQQLSIAAQLGEQGFTTGWPHRLCIAQARLKEAQGDLSGALASLDEAERQYIRNPLPDLPIAALKARVWIRQGRLIEAFSWAREHNLSPDDDLTFLREFEHVTLARALIARYKTEQVDEDLQTVLRLLERLFNAAENGGRHGSLIEILILQSLAAQALGSQAEALSYLERALALAEPEGYVRIFVNEGEALRWLIEKQSRNRDHPLSGYAEKLSSAFSKPGMVAQSIRAHKKSSLIEPLSERELDVLKLLRSELSGPEIAQQLVVSLNTVRTHTKNIYTKLGVNNRLAAVRRAEELDLI